MFRIDKATPWDACLYTKSNANANNVAAHESKRRILAKKIRQGASCQTTRGGEVQSHGKHI